VSAFTIPESAFHGHGLLGVAVNMIIGLLQIILKVAGCTAQLLAVSLGILVSLRIHRDGVIADQQLSISTTVYAAVHSRARLPIRRFLRRIDSQLNLIADDLGEKNVR